MSYNCFPKNAIHFKENLLLIYEWHTRTQHAYNFNAAVKVRFDCCLMFVRSDKYSWRVCVCFCFSFFNFVLLPISISDKSHVSQTVNKQRRLKTLYANKNTHTHIYTHTRCIREIEIFIETYKFTFRIVILKDLQSKARELIEVRHTTAMQYIILTFSI